MSRYLTVIFVSFGLVAFADFSEVSPCPSPDYPLFVGCESVGHCPLSCPLRKGMASEDTSKKYCDLDAPFNSPLRGYLCCCYVPKGDEIDEGALTEALE